MICLRFNHVENVQLEKTFCDSMDERINWVTVGVKLLFVFSRLKLEIAQLNYGLTGLIFFLALHMFFKCNCLRLVWHFSYEKKGFSENLDGKILVFILMEE